MIARTCVAAVLACGAALGGSMTIARAADPRPTEDEMFGGAATPGTPAPRAAPAAPGTPAAALGKAAPPPPSAGAASQATGDAGAPPPGSPPPAGPAGPTAAAAEAGGVTVPGPSSRDTDLLGDPNAGPRLSAETAPDDPLKIGGQIYLRSLAQSTENQGAGSIRFSTPSLVDGFFDARPNDRVRGFVLARMFFDPTLPTAAAAMPVAASASGAVAPSVPLLSGVQATRGPTTLLDQLWLRFDILHAVFVTAGRQHVKWGTARFWTPTDYLHPQARNPIAAFDARTGFTMLKVHVPWEERGWNFYGFALVEGVPQVDIKGRPLAGSDAGGTLGQIGAAGRAEVVLGAAELGLDAVAYQGHKPKFGADLSFGIGDFDLYVDAGLRYGSEIPRRSFQEEAVPFPSAFGMSTQGQLDTWVDAKYPVYYTTGIKPQITAGGTYSLKYNDNDVFVVTGEYFYNSVGYDDPRIYPGLFLSNSFQFFYTGRHYAALSAIAAAPYSWNYTTFTLTTLGNLSDQSFLTRLDYSLTVLTHLRFEAFGAVDYGRREGEFRLGTSGIMLPNGRTFATSPQSFSLGVGLRISI